jgi:plastocyanin
MTSRWLTCFSALPALAGSVAGQFELVDPRGARQANAFNLVVWLEPAAGRPSIAPASKIHVITQKSKRFAPHVSVVQVGTTVDLPNFDPIFHNAFSNFAGQPFDTGLYPPGGTHKVRFQREGVVRVFCNIHSTMSAVIVVTPGPWFATTPRDGKFRIADVPPGEYTLRVWHERSSEATLRALDRRIAVGDGESATPAAVVAESAVSAAPHLDKHGKPYGAAPDDRGLYRSRK